MAITEQPTSLSDEEIGRRVESWLRENLPTEWVAAVDAGDDEAIREARTGFDQRAFLAKLGESGWAQPTWPVEYCGQGLTPVQARVVEEVKTRYRTPRSWNIIGLGMGAPTVLQWGTHDQKLRFLPPIARDEEIWCQLFSEPGSGSDVAGLSTRAVRDGDEWIVNGQKVWTTLAHVAKRGMLVARTDPDAPKHKGLSYFIIDMEAPGVEVRPLKQITGDAEFNEVFFTDLRVPDANRLGEVGQGWSVATETLMNERVALSGAGSTIDTVGGGPVDDLVRFAKATGAWGDAVARQRLMKALSEGRLIRVTNYRAAAQRKSGRPGPEGSITKLFQAEYNKRLQELAIDLLGATGAAWDEADADTQGRVRGFLRSRANTIEGGTSEIMRNILGDRVLGLPREPDASKSMPWKDIPRNS